ncbi:MAG: alpha/beta fold hydrolase [Methanobacteriota archaeon]
MPGGVLPAMLAYPALVEALGKDVDARYKEPEIYATEAPPRGDFLAREVEGMRAFAEAAGFDRFHLVGYSAGAASSLAFCADYPERLLSLTLNEPGWVGTKGRSAVEAEYVREVERIEALPAAQRLPAFMRMNLLLGICLVSIASGCITESETAPGDPTDRVGRVEPFTAVWLDACLEIGAEFGLPVPAGEFPDGVRPSGTDPEGTTAFQHTTGFACEVDGEDVVEAWTYWEAEPSAEYRNSSADLYGLLVRIVTSSNAQAERYGGWGAPVELASSITLDMLAETGTLRFRTQEGHTSPSA